jgi:hypothetical protein
MNIALPYVSAEEFEAKVQQYRKVNNLVDRLLTQLGEDWQTAIPKHLHQQLFQKIGCKPDIKKY